MSWSGHAVPALQCHLKLSPCMPHKSGSYGFEHLNITVDEHSQRRPQTFTAKCQQLAASTACALGKVQNKPAAAGSATTQPGSQASEARPGRQPKESCALKSIAAPSKALLHQETCSTCTATPEYCISAALRACPAQSDTAM